MANPLSRFFAQDDLVALAAVFPSIKVNDIAKQTNLIERAKSDGQNDHPPSSSKTLTEAEISVIDRVLDIRKKGLENYERNQQAYKGRISRIQTIRTAVKAKASTVVGDFQAEVKAYRGGMVEVVKDVKEWNADLNAFREKHQIHRPAFKKPYFASVATLVLVSVMAETILNGYLFAQRNALGLLGGILIALLVSIVNVAFSGLSGHFAKLIAHRNWFLKSTGIAIIGLWGAATFFYNLAVAHFRDAVESLGEWAEAAETSLQSLTTTPFELSSIESWLLMAWGILIALTVFLKFVFQGEYYLGYQRIDQNLRHSLREYESQLDNALASLKERKEAAIEDLQDVNDEVTSAVGDAIDALQGQGEIQSHLKDFLTECDTKLNLLLQLYRDANASARTSSAPTRFAKAESLPSFKGSDVEKGQHDLAKSTLAEISTLIDEAVEKIQKSYSELQHEFPDADKLIGLDMLTSVKSLEHSSTRAADEGTSGLATPVNVQPS